MDHAPPQTIGADGTGRWQSDSDGFMTGTQGYLDYAWENGGSLHLNWDNPYVGSNSYSCATSAGYVGFVNGGSGDNSSVTYAVIEGVSNAASWMKDNLGLLGEKKLVEICITGSHDSGMSVATSKTIGAFDCNTITQTKNINGQLLSGARYFDIRPIIGGGQYYTGHYSKILKISMQGARGESIDDIIAGINSFVAENSELVILNLSHSMDTDAGNAGYPAFTQDQWNALFAKLSAALTHLYHADPATNLTRQTLNDFIGAGNAAVVVIVEDNAIMLGDYAGKGFFLGASFNVYNDYSDTNDLDTMAADQLNKMAVQRKDGAYFLLSWTLTQTDTEAATCGIDPTGDTYSILDLAGIANSALYAVLPKVVPPSIFPNIIYTDNYCDSIPVSMAMKINAKILA